MIVTLGHGYAVANEVRVCWENTEKPPYLMLNGSGTPQGISAEIVAAILRTARIQDRPVVQPWKRCLSDIANGTTDLVPNASLNEERAQYALFSKAIYRTHMAFFYDRQKYRTPPVIRTLDDLRAYRVGGVLGFNYAYLGETFIDTGAKSREALLLKLEAGRIDLAVEQREVMLEVIRRNGFRRDQFSYVTDPFVDEKTFHIMVSKRHPDAQNLLKKIDAAIDALIRNGTLSRITGQTTP